ncbi:MAG: hypothetical protein JWR67_2115 [Mucilaginibacter sp.]|nr:hypothetical protein [Mucilaginibacter sp.]
MSIKTIIAIIITALLTIILMQNTDSVKFTLLFGDVYISKLVVMTAVSVTAFILGIIVGRPKKAKYDIGGYHDSIHKKDDTNTLSDEDRDYIS